MSLAEEKVELEAEVRSSGIMLWFNSEKDLGVLQTADGERLDVPGRAFVSGERPIGRCAGRAIEFESRGAEISGVAFVQDLSPRRARLRHRR